MGVIKDPSIKIKPDFTHHLLIQTEEESQVIVHGSFIGWMEDISIRIWKSTFLFAKESTHRSELLHVDGISLFPTWTFVEASETFYFTLIFKGLPKDCLSFDLIEKIPEEGGFEIRNIQRNKTDVYHLNFT